jgi:exosortase/archaeosortase family protein
LIYFLLQAAIQLAPLGPLQELIAKTEATALGLKSSGSSIVTPRGVFVINPSCTGLVSASVLAAIVFALRRPRLKTKGLLFAIGAVALFFLNLARVFLVLLLGVSAGAAAADLAHTISWFATAGLILLLWFIGTKKIAGIKSFGELM